ncbi:hypothetical protein V9T40_003377 [Parthenolecanium corni]|uniref:Uncharacterized protein n=1 Tax=Parthenolecanium corni TaxID=536013 RepID=A0AAN9Y7X7_9HEMI
MEWIENDKFANAEFQSARSSQSQIDPASDWMRIIEENYQRFTDLMNQSAPIANNLEKELAKEDKKCTFLQYKIENLIQRYYYAKEMSATLQKSVRDQQMEIEKVSAVIYEQLRQLNAKFPPDGLSRYSDVVSVITSAGEWVENLKGTLQYDIEECERKTVKLEQQQQAVSRLIDRIRKLIVEKKEFEKSLKLRIQSVANPDFDSFKTHLSLLNEKFDEYQSLKCADNMRKSELNELKKKKVEIFNECKKVNQALFETLNKCSEIYASFRKECDEIKKGQDEFKNLYNQMMNDYNSILSNLTREIKKLDDDIYARKQDLDKLGTTKMTKMIEQRVISSQLEQLKLNYSNAENFIASCREQEKMSRDMKETVLEQINILKTTNACTKSLLEELTRKVGNLEEEYTSSMMGLKDSSVDSLQEKINQEQIEVDRSLITNQKFNDEILELKNVLLRLSSANYDLSSDLKLCQKENNFVEQFLEKVETEYQETCEKQLAATQRGMNKTLEDITNAYSSTFEKQLLIDSVQDDIHEYAKLLSEVQEKFWAANHKYEILRNEVAQLEKTISRENEARESKKKLLDDLEKNSFPKNKIPVNWFKSFEKQKQEYDWLVKERLELEKQRNKLIIEIVSISV